MGLFSRDTSVTIDIEFLTVDQLYTLVYLLDKSGDFEQMDKVINYIKEIN